MSEAALHVLGTLCELVWITGTSVSIFALIARVERLERAIRRLASEPSEHLESK